MLTIKKSILLLLLGLSYLGVYGQTDSIYPPPSIPNKEYAVYRYDSELLMDILTYRYTNLWDFDDDKQNDIIEFTSNGGAHAYYHLKIWLSSKRKWNEYPSILIDSPYPDQVESIDELDELYPQLVILDFDNDTAPEIYLSLDSYPGTPIEYGLTSKKILIDYKDGHLKLLDFKNK